MTWTEHLLLFYKNLQPPLHLPPGIEWLYPQRKPEVWKVVKDFAHRYYQDREERTLLLGINPGRFGAGVTGVNFTAPRQLSLHLELPHPFPSQTELSAEFIYEMIEAYGGPKAFYARFFISSVCPLGFVRGGRNLNYYDDPELSRRVEPFIVASMDRLLSFRVNRKHCICIGGDKNYRHLSGLNAQHGWFENISVVPHPRFIMQYKRKQKADFIQQYLEALGKI
ncbi:MAG: uracil-DNA glycosylase family protein [Flavisolibacter sp.]